MCRVCTAAAEVAAAAVAQQGLQVSIGWLTWVENLVTPIFCDITLLFALVRWLSSYHPITSYDYVIKVKMTASRVC